MKRLVGVLLVCCAAFGCGSIDTQSSTPDGGGDPVDSGVADSGAAASVTCQTCVETAECGPGAACVQYAGGDFCGHLCKSNVQCAQDELCLSTSAEDGTSVSVCVPQSGTCGETGCGVCDPGDTCDVLTGLCSTPDSDGGDEPDDGGSFDPPDAGPDAGPVGIGPDGGKVPRFIFAVIGDTRPPTINDTTHYPVKRVNTIYDRIQALTPRPQFVVATGDYMFASASGHQGKPQIDNYVAATKRFSGPVFGSMGNHECSGGNQANCFPIPANNNNMTAYLNAMVKPLGKTHPYYEIPFEDTNGKWTAKLLIVACNSWGAAQKTWLQNALKRRTDYTFVARHQPMGSDAPCVPAVDSMLKASGTRYTMLLVGHVHQYRHSGKQLLEGVGGAPLTGSSNFGFATVEQRAAGGVRVRQYDSTTGKVVSTYTLNAN